MMIKRILPVLLVSVLGATACGGDSSTPAADDSLPGVADSYEYPNGPDDVVIRYADVGGFVPREFAFAQTPNLLVSGDGRAFTPAPHIEIFPGPLVRDVQVQTITDSGIREILAAAEEADLLRQIDYERPTNIADAPTAQLTINVNGDTFVHEAYALGLAVPNDSSREISPERQALADFLARLADLEGLVGSEELGEQTMFEPESYGIEAVVVDDLSAYGSDGIDPTVLDWPATASVRLADASTCVVVPADEVAETLAAANQLTFFSDADVTYQVLARPILPGSGCD